MIYLFLWKMLITVKNKKLIFHLQINVEHAMDLEQNQDQSLFLVQYVVGKVKYDQVKVFLQFNKCVRSVLVLENKFLARVEHVMEWVKKAEDLGAGEILLTSVDNEGTKKGFDIELVSAVSSQMDIPVIASGGMGKLVDLDAVILEAGADAVAMAHVLHYGKCSIGDIRSHCIQAEIPVRLVASDHPGSDL